MCGTVFLLVGKGKRAKERREKGEKNNKLIWWRFPCALLTIQMLLLLFSTACFFSIVLPDCSNSLNQRMLFKRWCTWLKQKIVIVMFQMDLLLNFTLFNAIGCIFMVYSIHLIFHFVNWFWVGFFGRWHWMLCVVDGDAMIMCNLFFFFSLFHFTRIWMSTFVFAFYERITIRTISSSLDFQLYTIWIGISHIIHESHRTLERKHMTIPGCAIRVSNDGFISALFSLLFWHIHW